MKDEELTIDYKWDKSLVDIKEDKKCLCGSKFCRKHLLLAKGIDRKSMDKT